MTRAASELVWAAKSEKFWIIRFLQTCCSQCLWRLKSFSWLWCRSIGTFKKLIQKTGFDRIQIGPKLSRNRSRNFFGGGSKKSFVRVFQVVRKSSRCPALKVRRRSNVVSGRFGFFRFCFFHDIVVNFLFLLKCCLRTGPVKCPLMDFGVKPPFLAERGQEWPLGNRKIYRVTGSYPGRLLSIRWLKSGKPSLLRPTNASVTSESESSVFATLNFRHRTSRSALTLTARRSTSPWVDSDSWGWYWLFFVVLTCH